MLVVIFIGMLGMWALLLVVSIVVSHYLQDRF